MRLFGLAETLGEEGWLKALKLEDYAPRRSRRPEMLQQVLFLPTRTPSSSCSSGAFPSPFLQPSVAGLGSPDL
jgi:hypothetical protein